ncbi:Uncharacterised protein [uncultured Flavonifractor sp.]|nr:Uncharacterised protein [uncultured Flavonifractor sp.]
MGSVICPLLRQMSPAWKSLATSSGVLRFSWYILVQRSIVTLLSICLSGLSVGFCSLPIKISNPRAKFKNRKKSLFARGVQKKPVP